MNTTAQLNRLKEDMEKRWVDKLIHITSEKHPWYNTYGTVKSVDYTSCGWGLRIELNNGFCTYVYKSEDLKII